MNSDDDPDTDMTEQQEKLLGYCMYYGFSSNEAKEPTNTQKNEYIATQATVWIIMENLLGTDTGDKAASELCACAPDSKESYGYYTTLKSKIFASYNATRPSFASKTKSGAETYE